MCQSARTRKVAPVMARDDVLDLWRISTAIGATLETKELIAVYEGDDEFARLRAQVGRVALSSLVSGAASNWWHTIQDSLGLQAPKVRTGRVASAG